MRRRDTVIQMLSVRPAAVRSAIREVQTLCRTSLGAYSEPGAPHGFAHGGCVSCGLGWSVAGEAAQRRCLLHRDGLVAHLDPAASLEPAQRGVEALPGTS